MKQSSKMVDVLEAPARTSAPLTAPPKAPSSAPSSAGDRAPPTEAKPGPSRNLLVILHGKRVEDDLLRQALQEVKQQGHQLSVRVTFDRGDVEHFISEAVKLNDAGTTNYQTIVAGGGDGTLNEVVSALMQHREAVARQGLSLALIPLGTANDFACTAGISVDPREALRVALDASLIRPIDVATVNGRSFLNVAVAGGVADVPPDELSSKWKRLLGPLAIAFFVLKRLSSKRVLAPHAGTTISFNPEPAHPRTQHTPHRPDQAASGTQQHDQQQQQQQQQQQRYEFQTDLLMLVAGNSRQMGRTVAVCPDALLDDGLIDFTLLSGSSLAAQAAALVSALASGADNDPVHDSGICQLRASRLEVLAATNSSSSSSDVGGGGDDDVSKSGEAIPVNRDGEPEAASHRLVFEVLRRVLPMHLPDDRLLVSGQAAAAAGGPRAGGVRGSIKQPGKEGFLPATAAVPAAAAAAGESAGSSSASGEQQGRRKGGRRRRHRGLTVKTLRRMLAVAGPEGQGVRRNAHLAALGRKLAVSLGVVLLGGVLGWSVGGAKAAKGQEEQQASRVGVAGADQQPQERQPRHEKVLKRRHASQQVSPAAIV